MADFTANDVKLSFSAAAFQRGMRYQQQGRVRITGITADGDIIEGEVRGSQAQPYLVSAGIRRLATRRLAMGGECSCPLGSDCKHVVALLLQALADAKLPGGDLLAVRRSPPQPALTAETALWLNRFDHAIAASGTETAPASRQRLFYLLDLIRDRQNFRWPFVSAVSVRLLANGEFSEKTSVLDPAVIAQTPNPAKYLRPADLAIMRRLTRLPTLNLEKARILSGEDGAELIGRLLQTGRCLWQGLDGLALAAGEPRRGEITWRLTTDGRQKATIILPEAPDIVLLPTLPPWYVDAQMGVCGPVVTDMAPDLLEMLLAAPALAAHEVPLVRARLAPHLATQPQMLPPEPQPPRRITAQAIPMLRLSWRRLGRPGYWPGYRGGPDWLDLSFAQLSFCYDDAVVAAIPAQETTILVRDNIVHEVARQLSVERNALKNLEKLGLTAIVGGLVGWSIPAELSHDLTCSQGIDPAEDEDRWLDFLSDGLPELTERGWRIVIDDDFPLRLVEPDGEIAADLTEGSGIDWFELHLGIPVDGQRVDILPALLALLRDLPKEGALEFLGDEELDQMRLRLRLPDGRSLVLPFARLRPLMMALTSLFATGSDDGRLRLSVADAVELADLVETTEPLGLSWRGGDRLRVLGQRLRDGAGPATVTLPDSFLGSLRPYQQVGVAWMQLLRDVGLGGVLADDMGLGKTVQTLAHLAIEGASGRADRPSLIIAPTSVLPNWRAEAARFTPHLRLLALHGADRKERFCEIEAADIVLTTYPLIARDVEILASQAWHMVIVDEAQMVKNPATNAAKALRRLQTRHRLALTGTPIENNLGELWSLFDFVTPGFLGDAKSFAKTWRGPIEKQGDETRQAALARRVRPFLLRRSKSVVAADLPPKTEIIEHIELSDTQRQLYEAIRLAMHRKIREAIAEKGLKRSRIEFLDALLKLRQVCCDPRLLKTSRIAEKAASAKLVRLMEMLPELIGEGRNILLFSQFTSMLALIEAELRREQIPYVILTGETLDRTTPVRRFQLGEVPLFLISLKAGGTGLNLTAADTVIHYDPWWNPAVESQATDRAHRLGQDKPVFVHKLVAMDSIEVKMELLKSRKQALAEGLFSGDGGAQLNFTEDDVEFLLAGS